MQDSKIKEKLAHWNWTKQSEGKESKRQHKRQGPTCLHTQEPHRTVKPRAVIHTPRTCADLCLLLPSL